MSKLLKVKRCFLIDLANAKCTRLNSVHLEEINRGTVGILHGKAIVAEQVKRLFKLRTKTKLVLKMVSFSRIGNRSQGRNFPGFVLQASDYELEEIELFLDSCGLLLQERAERAAFLIQPWTLTKI